MILIFSNFVQRAAIWLLGNTEGLSLWKRQMNRGAFRSFSGFWAFKQSQAKSKLSFIVSVVEPGGCVVVGCALSCRASGKQPGLGLHLLSHRVGGGSGTRWGVKGPASPSASALSGDPARTSRGAVPLHPGLGVVGGATLRVRADATCPCTLLISPSGDTEVAGVAHASGVWGQVWKRQKALAYMPAACRICVCFWSHFYVIFWKGVFHSARISWNTCFCSSVEGRYELTSPPSHHCALGISFPLVTVWIFGCRESLPFIPQKSFSRASSHKKQRKGPCHSKETGMWARNSPWTKPVFVPGRKGSR